MNRSGYSKILKLKYKIIEFDQNKPSFILFEDNIGYNAKELSIVAQLDAESIIEAHRIKVIFNSMIHSLDEVL